MKYNYKLFILFSLLISFTITKAQNEFITEWVTVKNTIKFPGLGNNYTIVWESINDASQKDTIHNAEDGQLLTFPAKGSYLIKAYNGNGTFYGFSAKNYSSNKNELKYVRQWGNIHWTSLNHAFLACAKLDVTAADAPDLTSVTDLTRMFSSCTLLQGNSSFNNWNTQNVTIMSYMFASATAFNQSLKDWNTAQVTRMDHMFEKASAYNQPMADWNTSAVINLSYMFQKASAFNQPIGNWNTGNVTSLNNMFADASAFNQPIDNWDTHKVTKMTKMFQNATAFNQTLDNWNTQKTSDMENMFQNATTFNQSLANWDLSKKPKMANMLDNSGMDCNNYSASLIAWAGASSTPKGITLGAEGIVYNSTAAAAHETLVTDKNWIIHDDIYNAACNVSTPVTFGDFAATISDNQLSVVWNTISEINNKAFYIEISENGIDGWKKIATVQSKAISGNSNAGIDYHKTIPLTSSILAALSFLATVLIPGKKNKWLALMAACAIFLTIYSCSKTDLVAENNSREKIYIKLSQVDNDGTVTILGIKEAVRK